MKLAKLFGAAALFASMVATSLMGTLSGGLNMGNFTLKHFSALFVQQGDALSALGTSLSLALASARVVVVEFFLLLEVIHSRQALKLARAQQSVQQAVQAQVGVFQRWDEP